MRRAFFYARRTAAVLLVVFVALVVAMLVYAVVKEPLGGSILVLVLALFGGLLFLLWNVFRIFGRLILFVAGPSRREQSRGLGSEYEQMVRARTQRGWMHRR
jgi:hypothetical protein